MVTLGYLMMGILTFIFLNFAYEELRLIIHDIKKGF